MELLKTLYSTTGLSMLTWQQFIMIIVALTLLYLAIKKGYEPYLLLPISFGMLLVNLPGVPKEGMMEPGGLLYYLYQGVKLGIYPPLIFLAIGASTDFGPLIANPKSLLLGAAAQLGIFIAFIGAIMLGLTGREAASIGIIGGADGPTAIYTTTKLAPALLGPIAVAAYSYMALVPIIQPPIIRLLTTKEERQIKMVQLREVSKEDDNTATDNKIADNEGRKTDKNGAAEGSKQGRKNFISYSGNNNSDTSYTICSSFNRNVDAWKPYKGIRSSGKSC